MKIRVSAFSWAANGDGKWLMLRHPNPGYILDQLTEGEYDVEIKKHRERRTLDQNALYWATLTELARRLDISNNAAHNLILRRYGQVERYEGKCVYVVLPDTDEAEKKALEAEDYHLKPTSEVKHGNMGQSWRTWILLRGSRSYNTEEMTRLIDGLYDECRQLGMVLTDWRRE